LVRISACHAEGRGFESRPLRQFVEKNHPRVVFSRVGLLSISALYD